VPPGECLAGIGFELSFKLHRAALIFAGNLRTYCDVPHVGRSLLAGDPGSSAGHPASEREQAR
jgi:hypothetical protein